MFASVSFIIMLRFTCVYSGPHLARLYKLRSLKVPWLPRASADVMHEESSCLFTLPKGMLKSRTAEMLSFKSVGTAGSVKSFI